MTDAPTERAEEGIFTRMRHRKVVQWGIAYAAGAWGLLQGLQYISDAFAWPVQLRQIAILALLIGLPIVLVLAWYHGDRGQQRVSRNELAILTVLFLLGGALFWRYEHSVPSASTTATPTTLAPVAAAIGDARPSIAILPFANRSKVEDEAFFVDGIHDDILTQLSKVSALKVISRTSVEQFRDTRLSTKAIAEQLGVKSILEGGVQRAGNRVRINVQLINAVTDAHLWAETYDRELTAENIFAIQTELAAAIAGALKTALTPAEMARVNAIPTRSLEAWEAYQLGKQQQSKRTTATLERSERYFRRAIELDATFALAWVGVADTLGLQVYYGSRPRGPGLRDAEQAAARALQLDPNLAEAWAAAGNIAGDHLQLDRSEQMLRRAIAINPNYAPAYHWLSMTLTDLGRRDDALVLAERAVRLDPLSAIINNWLGAARQAVGRFDDAFVAYKKAIEIDPTVAIVYTNIADMMAYGLGRLDSAVPWFERAAELDPGNPAHPASLALAYWDLGNDAEAERWLAQTLEMGEGTAWSNYVAAHYFLAHGEEKSARRHAQTAAQLDPGFLPLERHFDMRHDDLVAARARYAKSFPDLFAEKLPVFNDRDALAAIDLALVLQHTGESERAAALLDRSEAYLRTIPRLGPFGYGLADVQIHALRGDRTKALATLRQAYAAGWRGSAWRYYRDFDPNLVSIRNEPEFKAVFTDIERDMARQRAELSKRPKDAPLDLASLQ